MNAKSLTDDFEDRAEEQWKAARDLLGAIDFQTNSQTQAACIIAKVTGNLLQVMSELTEFLIETDRIKADEDADRTREERNHAIRRAAARATATGDWAGFDELVDNYAGSTDGS